MSPTNNLNPGDEEAVTFFDPQPAFEWAGGKFFWWVWLEEVFSNLHEIDCCWRRLS